MLCSLDLRRAEGHAQPQGLAGTAADCRSREGDTLKSFAQMGKAQLISGLACLQLTQVSCVLCS